MKLQVAIDRVKLDEAIDLVKRLDGIADIIELGTSLIKDYGLYALKSKRISLRKSLLLMDIKTNDEGEYEFTQGFNAGADILSIMGSANKVTLDLAYQIAQQKNKKMLIDLMGLNYSEVRKIANYPNAIYNLHNSHDKHKTVAITTEIMQFKKEYPNIQSIAVAGGINLKQARLLVKQGQTEIVIVGSQIIKADNPIKKALEFKEAISHES